MADVVGMDGKAVEPKKAQLNREDILEMKAAQARIEEEGRRLAVLKLAVDISNPSTVMPEDLVAIATKFMNFIKDIEENKDGQGQADSVPTVAA